VDILARAAQLRRLHDAPDLLTVVNVWDAASARVVAEQPGCRAIATASHALAAAHGYPDGEQIPLDLVLTTTSRIVAAVDLPVTADLEAGYGDPETTVRRAISVGVAGGNIEDEMAPLPDAVERMRAAVRAGASEGVEFVLNARTDAFLMAGDRDPDDVFADAAERGRAFLDVGATCVFVPGVRDADTIGRLVDAIGPRKVSVLVGPGSPSLAELADLGVARVSCGPWPHRHALYALADLATGLLAGTGEIPADIRPLA
jgi:2-methylisocitrate lyase-like PEP mutase family enzyme